MSFAFKRGHIRATVAHRDMLKAFDITPARFDALYVIRWLGGSCYQSEIWKHLDLHPSTICRMLKSMEKRGLLVRERQIGQLIDCRQVTVTLTRSGFDTIVKAIKAFLRTDELRAFYNRMHRQGVDHIKSLVAGVRNIGEWLHDFATHYYPAETPDVAAGERYDAEVKAFLEAEEETRNRRDDLARRRAAVQPEDDPFHHEYHTHPRNKALRAADPKAWDEKISRDVASYPMP